VALLVSALRAVRGCVLLFVVDPFVMALSPERSLILLGLAGSI
jgi:hypothetical protein